MDNTTLLSVGHPYSAHKLRLTNGDRTYKCACKHYIAVSHHCRAQMYIIPLICTSCYACNFRNKLVSKLVTAGNITHQSSLLRTHKMTTKCSILRNINCMSIVQNNELLQLINTMQSWSMLCILTCNHKSPLS